MLELLYLLASGLQFLAVTALVVFVVGGAIILMIGLSDG